MSRADRARGQATVELALSLPFVAAALLLVVQVALVAHDQLLVTHAAREAARAAAVGAPPPPLDRLDPVRVQVEYDQVGAGLVQVRVRYQAPTDVPIVGALIADVDLAAEATMVDEQAGSSPP